MSEVRRPWRVALVSMALSAGACGDAADAETGRAAQPVIYGSDDRVEALDFDDASLAALVRRRVGALIPSYFMLPTGDGDFELAGPTLAETGICADEPHADEPALAGCTALRVSPDRIVTAGHCFTAGWLSDAFFVTGYFLGGDLPFVSASNAHEVDEVLLHVDGDLAEDPSADFAVATLRRPVADDGVELEFASRPPSVGDAVIVAGTSEGLPLKIDAGALVTRRFGNAFELTSDTFVGGSGSPVFTADDEVAGMVVGGNLDYDFDRQGECLRARIVSGTPESAELAVDASVLEAALDRSLRTAAESCGMTPGGAGTSPWGSVIAIVALLGSRARRRPRLASEERTADVQRGG